MYNKSGEIITILPNRASLQKRKTTLHEDYDDCDDYEKELVNSFYNCGKVLVSFLQIVSPIKKEVKFFINCEALKDIFSCVILHGFVILIHT